MRISPEMNDLAPGPLIKVLREEMGLTQKQLGLLLTPTKNPSEISAIESGDEGLAEKRAEMFAEFFKVPRKRFMPKVEVKT